MNSEKKVLWHTYYYSPKKPQEGFALFVFSFLSLRKESSAHLLEAAVVAGHVDAELLVPHPLLHGALVVAARVLHLHHVLYFPARP